MEYLQPSAKYETPTQEYALPLLRLPQVTPAQVIAKRQRYEALTTQVLPNTPSFSPTPLTPPYAEPSQSPRTFPAFSEKQDEQKHAVCAEAALPFSTASVDFSQSLRARVTYIPPSMTRHKEPTMADALLACGTLLFICLFLLLLLYCIGL